MSIDPNLEEFYGVDKPESGFDQVSIRVASPDAIREWSRGEVINPETINYRTFKPEKGGLFCERIFGPTKDWQCACGKYKSIKYKAVTCDRCGVEVTLSRVRRERMGHIELAVPVTHIWFYKCMPSRLGLALDMTARSLERVIYYEDFIVIDPGNSPLETGQLLTETELREAEDEYGESFRAGMGAEAVKEILSNLDLAKEIAQIEEDMEKTRSKQNRKKFAKRLKLMRGFAESYSRPEWMVLDVLPVLPPDLRPLVPLEGGRFATSDLNDLYRRVINRNNRLKNLLMLKTPDVIIRNEKRMLQEAVDALFDNGRHGRAVTGAGNRPLKSLSDMLKGKGGRFRQNLLGKRVDYSGRSVIVIGPELRLNQCGLPKKMALVLFEPFIIRRLKEMGYVHTVRSAKKMIERKTPEVWDILEEVTKGHPVLLNRAPTLHRLSIQAFEPVLIEGAAIRLHPLTCSAYNADFDGDQMAVHVPLSVEAQMEARMLMLAPNNIFSPSSGKPITTPSQDIILGSYYLTHRKHEAPKNKRGENAHLPMFANTTEVEFAIASRKLGYHDAIRLLNPDFGKDTVFGDKENRVIETTPGRVRFNEIWPEDLGFINSTVSKGEISNIIWRCYQVAGQEETVKTLDRLKALGFKEATRSGASIGIVDMVIPEQKQEQLRASYEALEVVENQRKRGIITDGERYNKIIDTWTQAGDEIQKALYAKLEHNDGKKETNPLFMMVDSGARGNKQQIKQLSGMRGLMAKPSGEIIERPITSNFREGLSVLEYFISTHGARKGLADTALKTADSGYMTRKLVDVAQDVIVTIKDCKTLNGITVESIYEGDEEVVDLATRIYGRTSAENVKDPVSGEFIVQEGDVITEDQAARVQDIGVEKLKIRSVLTCSADRGCCVQCYGLNLATGKKVKVGTAVGIIAAQSIGEPGTQLTMRTFHVGGTASATFKQPIVKAKNGGFVRYNDVRTVEDKDGNYIALNKNGSASIVDEDGRELENYNVVIGSVINIADGDKIRKGSTLLTWDPYNVPIITEKAGKVEFRDMIMGITIGQDESSGDDSGAIKVIEHKDELHPQIVIVDVASGEVQASYSVPTGANLSVKEGEVITAGTQVARTPRKVSKTKDITGGLPRVAELFEARTPKDPCVIAKIDGVIDINGTVRGKKKVIVRDPETLEEEDHLIPMNKHIIVQQGDTVKRGQQLTEGPAVPHDILDVLGPNELQAHLTNEVQEVYRLQGVEINDKHIEIIIRQMLRKVKVTEPGDSDFLWGDQVEKSTFERINREIIEEGGKPAEGEPVLLGITKASLETESFISAASFQDTTRVLTEAATLGKIDTLDGFKENVIMGHLIPAGTGFRQINKVEAIETEIAEEFASADTEAAEPQASGDDVL
ncbi:DNA-directed RNA polymerase subunit beta' [Sulfuriroseicoccus oceanibius]|uniref:DNA-directed RNA polymerase subunit beta' n=1 Tax=Sulfuriroseicoccus oceanibius TaxID=2707525 RepID=A0A6B3L8Q1_9BACT|nr:DNA-directed RNA polymerase subunit beta' [Sulfuriroseicoccus oceanibius]QQL45768.1 DNA-directed RNA polymerase subunit beta' [Sulfuriroseicoccus oceanibius]